MRCKHFGTTGLMLTPAGIGGLQFSKITHEEVTTIITRARELGLNWIETAYGYFDSEEKIGQAVGGNWSQWHIISKTGDREATPFRAHALESLQRLRTDHFDLYQFHGVDNADDWRRLHAPGMALDAARALQAEGVIRHLGVSTHSLELAMEMVETAWVESIQLPISFIHREVEDSPLLARASERGVGILAMKPFGGGRLADGRLCLGYIFSLPGVFPVAGVEASWQVEEMAALAENPPPLGTGDIARMETIQRELGVYFCRACRYCEPCPQEIRIYAALYFPVYLKQMGVSRVLGNGEPAYLRAARTCTECGVCESRCPFQLHIRDGLKASIALYEQASAGG